MTVKSLKKQLVAAIAMVLVSVLALSSATFAWFANNNKVTADGMTINAKAEGSLLVIGKNATELATSVTTTTLGVEAEDLFPVHPIYTTGDVTAWNHNFSDDYKTAISGDTAETAVATADYGKYFLKTTLLVGLDETNEEATCGAVKVSKVTLTSANNDLLPSARILVVADKKVVGVYGNGGYVSAQGDATTADTLAAIPEGGQGAIIDGLSVAGTSSVEVTLYVYFDGRDASCTSKNFNAADVTAEIEFTAAAN